MTVTLRPLRADEFADWLEQSHAIYVHDMAAVGVAAETARAKSERDHRKALPDGIETTGQFLYVVEDEGRKVGNLWLADRDGEFGREMFVYAINIDPDHRGRGLGRAAMLLAEDVARGREIGTVSLNVFGDNEVARGLYRSLGYREAAVAMRKDL